MSLGDSILQTASIVRCVSVAVTASDHTTFDPSVELPGRDGVAQSALCRFLCRFGPASRWRRPDAVEISN